MLYTQNLEVIFITPITSPCTWLLITTTCTHLSMLTQAGETQCYCYIIAIVVIRNYVQMYLYMYSYTATSHMNIVT